MGLGPGGLDSEGVYQYGEDDVETLMSDMLNLGMDSVSQQFALDRARLDDLEADTGWITPTLLNGWTVAGGIPVRYRRKNGVTRVVGRVSGGSASVVFVLPAGFRPGQTFTTDGVAGAFANGNVTATTGATRYLDSLTFIAET